MGRTSISPPYGDLQKTVLDRYSPNAQLCHAGRRSSFGENAMAKFLCNYVNGKWVETGRTFANVNPANGSKVCDVSEADQATVDQAVKGAQAAMAGEWGNMSSVYRSV